jgi:hypothetical protein
MTVFDGFGMIAGIELIRNGLITYWKKSDCAVGSIRTL